MDERLEAIVSGKVQGVWFRDFTRRVAVRLGLVGEVKNLPDGTVHVIAEGKPDALEKLIEHLHLGPRDAKVEKVAQAWKKAEGTHAKFNIV